jgi:hypothetical protein
VKGSDWLDFCDIPSPVMSMITEEQQFAEKIHAYTLPRDGRQNSRVKDLVDLLLLLDRPGFDLNACYEALHTVFRVRGTHHLPDNLLPPPDQWEVHFQKMAFECGLDPNMIDAYIKVDSFFQKVVSQTVK